MAFLSCRCVSSEARNASRIIVKQISFPFKFRYGPVLKIDLLQISWIMDSTLTEFEENLFFDIDDPDFAPPNPCAIAHNVLHNVQFSDIAFGVNKCKYIHSVHFNTNVLGNLRCIGCQVIHRFVGTSCWLNTLPTESLLILCT